MTRTDDRMLYDMYGELNDYRGKKKTYDLKNRLRFAKEANAGALISIHMNKFHQPQYSGLQVYYSPNNAESERKFPQCSLNADFSQIPEKPQSLRTADTERGLRSRCPPPLRNGSPRRRLQSKDQSFDAFFISGYTSARDSSSNL